MIRDEPSPWQRVVQPAGAVTLRLQERLKERTKADRRRLAQVWGKRLAIVAAAVAVAWVVALSPVFRFEQGAAEVTGAGAFVDMMIVDAAIAAHDGESLVLLDGGHLEDQLREVPAVADAQVEKVWPKGLLVTLTAREPVAAIPQEDGTFLLVDDEAETVFREEAPPADLPVVQVPVADGARVLAAVLGVIDELPVDLRARVENIEAPTEDSVRFTLRDGPQVEWGGVDESATKAQVLEILLASEAAAGAKVIDVSAPTLPITTS